MTTPILKLTNLNKSYQATPILREICLEVEAGDFLALIGPSGAGKSTLLRLINLLEKPDSGQIFFEGTDTVKLNENKLLEIRRQMTMVMQRSMMLTGTVTDNVEIGLKLRKVKDELIKKQTSNSLEFVGLQDFAKRKASTLSGGEMQRVALARAIALEPKILLLDEPTANLDPKNVAIVENLIKEIKKTLGTTVIMVTHNMFQAKRMAAKTVLMHQGKIVEVAATAELFNNPKMALTKDFITGAMVY